MEKFSIERARQGATVKTRCGFLVKTIIYDPSIDDETPVVAIVMEVVEKYGGRKRKKRFRKKLTETSIEPCTTLYHTDGRLYADKDDPFDLVIVDSDNNEDK